MNTLICIEEIISDVTSVLDKPIERTRFEVIDRGVPHVPVSLPEGKMGVYIFLYEDRFLKIGKVGLNSNARFKSQHYLPYSSKSNLAKSILSDETMICKGINEKNVGDWIKNNCQRVDVLIDSSLGIFSLGLIEAVLHYKFEPIYEGVSSQR